MKLVDCTEKYCVIGAGASGLTVAKNLRDYQLPFDVIEREDEVGGNWYYGRQSGSMAHSTYFGTFKRFTEYTDFPMPQNYPDHPHHSQILAYLRSYAQAFDLYPTIVFNTSVKRVEPANSFWDVTLDTGEVRCYRGVIIANGHRQEPNIPAYSGHFTGLSLHSSEYRTPHILCNRRALIIGEGPTGRHIAMEAAQNAQRTIHSTRSEIYRVYGKPGRNHILFASDNEEYQVVKTASNVVRVFKKTLTGHVGLGEIVPKPDVLSLHGNRVLFIDGSEECVEVVVYATGFTISFPFIDKNHLNWNQNQPHLYLNIFHPLYDTLFVAGLITCKKGEWRLVDYQAQLIAKFISLQKRQPSRANFLRQLKAKEFLPVSHEQITRCPNLNSIKVEYSVYFSKLKRLIKQLDTDCSVCNGDAI